MRYLLLVAWLLSGCSLLGLVDEPKGPTPAQKAGEKLEIAAQKGPLALIPPPPPADPAKVAEWREANRAAVAEFLQALADAGFELRQADPAPKKISLSPETLDTVGAVGAGVATAVGGPGAGAVVGTGFGILTAALVALGIVKKRNQGV